MAVASRLRKAGGCTTTALQPHRDEPSDLDFCIRSELLETWLRIWEELPKLRMAISVVPEKLVQKTPSAK